MWFSPGKKNFLHHLTGFQRLYGRLELVRAVGGASPRYFKMNDRFQKLSGP